MSNPSPPGTLRFSDFELDVPGYQLRHKGRPVRLERQPMDLLILLAERRPHLVTRDEIAARLWGKDVFVDVETGVHTAIRKIRAALRDSVDAPTCVETVTGKGYRFIAPVETAEPPAAITVADPPVLDPPVAVAPAPPRMAVSPSPRPRALIALAIVAAVTLGIVAWATLRPSSAARVTIGVLPFANMSGDPGRDYLADGLAEEMIASLGQIDPDRVGVIGRTSTAAYKATRKSLADIGAEIGADYLVEGSIRAEGERLRITARLVRSRDQTQVWSASFDRAPTSVVALQREVSEAIAEQVHLRLSPDRMMALARRHTADAEAYDLYLRGRFLWAQLTPATNARALEYFQRAIAIDPDYALAWAGIGSVLLASPINGDAPPLEVIPRVRDATLRAMRAGPDLPEVLEARGSFQFLLEWDWAGAEASLRRAIALDPGDAFAHRYLGHLLSQEGRQAEATALLQRARELEPLYAMNHAISSQIAFQGRDYEGAVEHARRAIALGPDFWIGHVMLGQASERLGRDEVALSALATASTLSGGNSKPLAMQGQILGKIGRTAEARAVLQSLEARGRERYVPPYAEALVYLGLGDRDGVLRSLEAAVAAHDVHLIFLARDAKWDPYRDDPRFQSVIARCGFLGPGTAR